MVDLVAQTLRPLVNDCGGRLRAGGDRLRLKPRNALAIPMTLRDLATSEAEYGSLSNEHGSDTFACTIQKRTGGSVPRLP